MITKGRSPTMRHVSRTHRVALGWLLDRINLDPKIQIKDIDTKNQLADILTKGTFTRNEWNHLLCLCNIPFQFYRVFWSDVDKNATRFRWRKSHSKIETNDEFGLAMQRKDSCRASFLSQFPLSSWTEQHERTGKLVLDAYSSSYSEWTADKTWSSQEWKSDEVMEDRMGRPVNEQPPVLFIQHWQICCWWRCCGL